MKHDCERGGVRSSVHCDASDEISKAKHLLTETGAEDIASSSEEAVTLPTNTRKPVRVPSKSIRAGSGAAA